MSFCSQESSKHDKILPLSRAVNLSMSFLKCKTSQLIQSIQLSLGLQKQDYQRPWTPCIFNTQQDVPEILEIVIDELNSVSQVADNIISSTLQT